jgi:uroporphyrinogen III methyltransferase/synthase
MGRTGLTGKRCLLLRADIARKNLPETLNAAGAVCDDIAVYRTGRPEALPAYVIDELAAGRVHWATFTSASTFTNLVELLGDQAEPMVRGLKLASIGPITSRAVRSAGHEPTVEARTHTTEGLAEAITAYVSRQHLP